MNLHRSRLLAFLSGAAVLAGLALPWKYYLCQGERGRVTPIDHWGGETLEALLLAVLVVPLVVLAALGIRTAAPKRLVAVPMLVLGGLAFLLGILLLGLVIADPKWDAGAGFFLQLLGTGCGLAAGILACRRRPTQTALDLAERFCLTRRAGVREGGEIPPRTRRCERPLLPSPALPHWKGGERLVSTGCWR